MNLTVIMLDHAANICEGDFWGDVIASIIQAANLVVLDYIHALSVNVSDGEGITSCPEGSEMQTINHYVKLDTNQGYLLKRVDSPLRDYINPR